MNNVVIIGRLTRDPDLRQTPNGTSRATFTLAVDRGLSREKKAEAEAKGYPTADFIPITAWGKTAELVSSYLSKGSQVAIQGMIQTSSYDGQDGNRIYRTDVIADRVEFIAGRNENSNNGIAPSGNAGPINCEDMTEMSLDDIPF